MFSHASSRFIGLELFERFASPERVSRKKDILRQNIRDGLYYTTTLTRLLWIRGTRICHLESGELQSFNNAHNAHDPEYINLELKTGYNPGLDQFLTAEPSRVWYSNCAGAFQPSLVSRSATLAVAIHRPLESRRIYKEVC